MSVRDVKQGPHQYGKEWAPFRVLAESPVSGLSLLFITHLIDSNVLEHNNVSNVLQIIAKGH